MTRRSYRVLVDPDRSSEDGVELARRLAPLTDHSQGALESALERGAVTLETDLDRREAERICDRIVQHSAPAEIRDVDGDLVERFDGEEGADEQSSDGPKGDGTGVGDSDSGAVEEDDADHDRDAVLEFDAAATRASQAGEKSATASESATSGAGELDRDDPASGDDGWDPNQQLPSPGPPGAADTSRDSTSCGETDGGARDRSTGASNSTSDTSSGPEAAFDAAGMTEMLEGDSDADTGSEERATFEERPAHVPVLAAVLSALAPGAGQHYNGDSEEAWRYAVRALLIVPWFRSVREALERGRDIREGRTPKPDPGNFKRALRHLGTCWLAAGGIAFAVWLAAGLVGSFERVSAPVAVEDSPAERRARALQAAQNGVRESWLEAWERTGEQPTEEGERYTMTEVQRAARLYRLGYRRCRARKYSMCETMMRKVAKLDSRWHAPAVELQVWANVKRKEGSAVPPMPDVVAPGAADVGTRVDADVGGSRDAGGAEARSDATTDANRARPRER